MNDILWYFLFFLILVDFTIASELPRWMFAFEKHLASVQAHFLPIRFYGTGLQILLGGILLVCWLIQPMTAMTLLVTVAWGAAIRGLAKLMNLLPTGGQQVRRQPFEILDFYPYYLAYGQCFLRIKARHPELGTRVLPPIQCILIRRSQRIVLRYRQGALGFLYRFPWDPIF